MTHNHYIKKLSASKINDLINYVFPNIEPAMLTDRDDRLSLFTVYYGYGRRYPARHDR